MRIMKMIRNNCCDKIKNNTLIHRIYWRKIIANYGNLADNVNMRVKHLKS